MAGFSRRTYEEHIVTVKTWVATHTGLPSIYSDNAVRVTAGDRVLADGSAPVLLSDARAEPGEPITYHVDGIQVVMTRRADGPQYALLTRLNGRGISGLWYRDLGDPESWDSDVVRYPGGGARWSEHTPMRTGSGRFILWDPTQIPAVWDLLQSKAPLVVAAAAPVPGASPLRVITVDRVGRERLTPQGATTWDVTWTEYPRSQVSGAAPVVTWGEWQAFDHGWKSRTMLDLARLIAGMPA